MVLALHRFYCMPEVNQNHMNFGRSTYHGNIFKLVITVYDTLSVQSCANVGKLEYHVLNEKLSSCFCAKRGIDVIKALRVEKLLKAPLCGRVKHNTDFGETASLPDVRAIEALREHFNDTTCMGLSMGGSKVSILGKPYWEQCSHLLT